jgi:hypothetical protein
LGWKGLGWDDALAVFNYVCFIFVAFALYNVVTRGAQNVNIPKEAVARMSPDMVHIIETNSKWIFLLEHMLLFCVFGAKYSILMLYRRLT